MSILSISSTVKLAEQVRPAVCQVSRRSGDISSGAVEDLPIRFCVLKPALDAETLIDLDSPKLVDGESSMSTWENIVKLLPKDQCRVVLAQVPWRAHSDGVMREKLVFIQWTPSDTSVKQRMMASMLSKGVKQTIEQWIGPTVRVEAHGVDDLDLHYIQERIRSTVTVK